jgi:hypothetical protein
LPSVASNYLQALNLERNCILVALSNLIFIEDSYFFRPNNQQNISNIIFKMKNTLFVLFIVSFFNIGAIPFSLANNQNSYEMEQVHLTGGKLAKGREIDVSKISIGKIKIKMNTSTVTKILGQPSRKQVEYDDVCYSSYITTLNYKQLEVGAFGQNIGLVYNIKTTNPAYATSEGVKVGDPISKAKKAYAKYQSQQDSEALRYVNQAFGGLKFTTRQGIITEIDLLGSSC